MRTTQLRTSALAALATSTLLGLAAGPATAATTTTETERGIVLECTGAAHGLSAYVNLYENDRYGNYVQVVLDDDPQKAASREPERDFFADGEIHTRIRVDGLRARIDGTAHRVKKRTVVHDEFDDAGMHVVVDGFHRRLVNDLVLRYDGTRVPLTCAPAFAYNLTVSKTPIEG